MKIGIDARFWHSDNTGIGQYTQGLIHALSQIDRSNEYVVFLRQKDLEEWDVGASNFRPIVLDIPHYSLSEQLILPWKLLSHRLDLVHFTNFNHPIFYPGRFTVTIHDLAYYVFPGQRLKARVFKWGYFLTMRMAVARAAKIIAVTKYTRDEIVRRIGGNPRKIKVILEGVDIRRMNRREDGRQLREQLNLKDPVVFYVGNWRLHKNIPKLLEAFALLRQNGLKTQLLLAGKASEEGLALINNHPFKKDIVVAGFVPEEELARYFAAADIFVYPSLYEGFGLQILEAQNLGLPVAASNTTTLPEVGGEGARYFNPLDEREMALVVSNILEDKTLQAELVKKGYDNLKRFSWEKAAKETLKVFEEVVHGR